jgi:hypothetical protein
MPETNTQRLERLKRELTRLIKQRNDLINSSGPLNH